MQIEFTQANGGHDSAVQCITVEQQYLYSADWHGNIKVQCYCASAAAAPIAANRHAMQDHYCAQVIPSMLTALLI
jgi:hypothetical protein